MGSSPVPGIHPVLAPDRRRSQLDYTGNDRRRTDGDTLTLAATVGLPIGKEGFIDLAAEFQDRNDTNRTGADPRRQFNLISGALDPRELTFNRFSHRYGDPETEDWKVFANSVIPIGSAGTEVYGFASYNDRQGESGGFYRLANDARNTPSIYPEGFLPLITTDTDDYAGTLGVRGELMSWNWDVSGQYGQDKVDFTIKNSLNRSLGASFADRIRFGRAAVRPGAVQPRRHPRSRAGGADDDRVRRRISQGIVRHSPGRNGQLHQWSAGVGPAAGAWRAGVPRLPADHRRRQRRSTTTSGTTYRSMARSTAI